MSTGFCSAEQRFLLLEKNCLNLVEKFLIDVFLMKVFLIIILILIKIICV